MTANISKTTIRKLLKFWYNKFPIMIFAKTENECNKNKPYWLYFMIGVAMGH